MNGTTGALAPGNRNANVVYAVSAPGYFLKSTDSGAVWSTVASAAYDIHVPADQNISDDISLQILRFDGDIYKNYGTYTTWLGASDDWPASEKSDRLTTYRQDSSIIYVLSNASGWKLRRSQDGGTTWEDMIAFGSEPCSLSVWPYDPTVIHLLLENGVFYSSDGGQTFVDKTGNWSTVMGEAFAAPVKIEAVWIT